MNTRAMSRTLILLAAALLAGPSAAADALSKDLTSTIALLGLPCGKVVAAKKLGDNDYLATCQNRNVYRVYVNSQGRVVADKR